MIFNELITNIILGFILFISVPIAKLIGSYIKISINNINHESLQHAIWILVNAAENIFLGEGKGMDKFQYVYARISKKFPWASDPKIKEYIEEAVRRMSLEFKKSLGKKED